MTCASREWRKHNPGQASSKEAKRNYRRERAQYWERRVRLGGAGNERKQLSIAFLSTLKDNTPRCQCCGIELDYSTKAERLNQAQLDKVRPELGYRPDNVQIICAPCNVRRQDSSVADLQRIIDYINRYAPPDVADVVADVVADLDRALAWQELVPGVAAGLSAPRPSAVRPRVAPTGRSPVAGPDHPWRQQRYLEMRSGSRHLWQAIRD